TVGPRPQRGTDDGQAPRARESERDGWQHRGGQDRAADAFIAWNAGGHIRTTAYAPREPRIAPECREPRRRSSKCAGGGNTVNLAGKGMAFIHNGTPRGSHHRWRRFPLWP